MKDPGAVQKLRTLVLVTGTLVLLSLIAAGVSAASAAKAPKPPLVMGFVGAQTGWMSTYDRPVLVGMKAAADWINGHGGVLGRKIKFITCDSKSDPAQGGACAKEVIGKGAVIVLPPCDFDQGAPAARAANDAGVVAIGCAGSPQFGAQGIGPLVYSTSAGAGNEGALMAEWAYQKKGWRHPYVITDVGLEYTKTVASAFKTRWNELAGKDSIVGQDTFNNSDASAAAQISRLQRHASKADFIVFSSYPPGGPSVMRQIRAAGIELPIVASAAFDGTYWLKTVPNLSQFYFPALGSLFHDDPSLVRAKFLDRTYARLAGSPPQVSSYPLQGYATMELLARAMKKAKTTNGAALAKAMNQFKNAPTIVGPVTYTKNCHVPLGRPYLMLQIQNGKGSYTGMTLAPKRVPPQIC